MNTPIRFVRTASFAALLAMAISVPVAGAQSNRSLARATVPFAFQYGTRSFPAGRYTFNMVSDSIMAVHGKSSTGLGLVERSETPAQDQTGKLIFHHDGDRYVLQDVWVPALSAHLICPQVRQHKHAEVAAAKPAGPDVEVALLQMPR